MTIPQVKIFTSCRGSPAGILRFPENMTIIAFKKKTSNPLLVPLKLIELTHTSYLQAIAITEHRKVSLILWSSMILSALNGISRIQPKNWYKGNTIYISALSTQ